VEISAESSFDGHTIAQTTCDSSRWQSKFNSPVFYALRFAIERYRFRRSTISGLNLNSHPTTILRAIASVVIFAIQRMSLGPVTHIRKEVAERAPTLTDGDSSGSIVLPRCRRRVCASGNHRMPDPIDRCLTQAVCLSLAVARNTSAIAARSEPLDSVEIVSINLMKIPALALTSPTGRADATNNDPQTIGLAGDILESSHVAPRTCGVVRGSASGVTLSEPRYFSRGIA